MGSQYKTVFAKISADYAICVLHRPTAIQSRALGKRVYNGIVDFVEEGLCFHVVIHPDCAEARHVLKEIFPQRGH